MSAPDRIVTNKSGTMIITPPAIPLHETDIEWVRADLCDPMQDERVKALEAENARLREAGQAVVDEYPVSAGTSPGLCGDESGYGSIYRLRAALRALDKG